LYKEHTKVPPEYDSNAVTKLTYLHNAVMTTKSNLLEIFGKGKEAEQMTMEQAAELARKWIPKPTDGCKTTDHHYRKDPPDDPGNGPHRGNAPSGRHRYHPYTTAASRDYETNRDRRQGAQQSQTTTRTAKHQARPSRAAPSATDHTDGTSSSKTPGWLDWSSMSKASAPARQMASGSLFLLTLLLSLGASAAMTQPTVHQGTHFRAPAPVMLKQHAACTPGVSCMAQVGDIMPDGPAPAPPDDYTTHPDVGCKIGKHKAFTDADRATLADTLRDGKGAFAYSMSDLPGYCGSQGDFRIQLDTSAPIFTGPRRQSPLERQVADEKCNEMLDAGIIAPCSNTHYASATTMPVKKDEHGNWTDRRFCVDFRPLNTHTIPDRYVMQLPEDLFHRTAGCTIFSKLDLRSGFFQIKVHPDDQDKTAFWWGNKLYKFLRMPFGARNASATFQRVMDFHIAEAGLSDHVSCYIDDLLIFSRTPAEHIAHVKATLIMLESAGLRAHPGKSIFASPVVEYLGHNISADGITPHHAKIAASRPSSAHAM
jgi:hypothetical protein